MTIRPKGSLVTAYVVGAIAACVTVYSFTQGVGTGIVVLGPMVLVATTAWLVLANPHVRVDDSSVTVVNPLRTFVVDFQSVTEVVTRFALTIHAADHTVVAWSAPAPSGRDRVFGGRDRRHDADAKSVPPSAIRVDGTVRPGDLPGSSSGDAASMVRRRWESARASGALDELPVTPVRAEWNRVPLLLVALGILMTVLTSVAP